MPGGSAVVLRFVPQFCSNVRRHQVPLYLAAFTPNEYWAQWAQGNTELFCWQLRWPSFWCLGRSGAFVLLAQWRHQIGLACRRQDGRMMQDDPLHWSKKVQQDLHESCQVLVSPSGAWILDKLIIYLFRCTKCCKRMRKKPRGLQHEISWDIWKCVTSSCYRHLFALFWLKLRQ